VNTTKSRAAWLRDVLSGGPVLASEVKTLAKREGISIANLNSAKKKLNVRSWKGGFQGVWWWELPDESLDNDDRDALVDRLTEFAAVSEDRMMSQGLGLDWPRMVELLLDQVEQEFVISKRNVK
jgi:hypothetical protein